MHIITKIRKGIGYTFIAIAMVVGLLGAYLAIDEEDFQRG